MEKKNVVEGDISNIGIVNIGDTINNVNLIITSDNTDELKVTKALFRVLYAKDLFEIPSNYIARSLTHLKAIQDAKPRYYHEIECRAILELLNERNRIVILGDAGMGKSTELKYIFNLLYESNENIFPIFISLKEYIFDGLLNDRFPHLETVSHKNIYFILDGYDEISELDQPKINRQIENLISQNPGIKILISSRKNTYDIKSDTSTSYLSNFEIYYLNELTIYDVERYFTILSNVASFEEFKNELEKVKLMELATNPFYLKILIEVFLNSNSLPGSRSEVMRLCIDNMIMEDIKKIKNSKSVDKFELFTIIEKVALSIELVNKNFLTENELRELLSREEFKLLKYFGGFKKETGKNDIWRFDHNNFQEYLAAKAISNCSFERMKRFISFAPDYQVLNPSWLNTIGYLLSAVEDKPTFTELLDWLIKHNKEFLVGVESNRIDSNVRIQVFKAIFEEYERNEMYLYSNLFTDQQLVKFANDNYEIFKYLMAKINDSSSVIVIGNGLRLLGCIDYTISSVQFGILFNYCFDIISSKNDDIKIGAAISCLAYTQKVVNEQVEYILAHVCKNNNQEVIYACIKLIDQSSVTDNFIDYITWAFVESVYSKVHDIGLNWYIENLLGRISTRAGMEKLFFNLNNIDWTSDLANSVLFMPKIIDNAISLYEKDSSFYHIMLNAVKKPKLFGLPEVQRQVLRFFNETGTRDKAVIELWKAKNDRSRNAYMIALLVTIENIYVLQQEINNNTEYTGDTWIQYIVGSFNDQKEEILRCLLKDKNLKDDRSARYFLSEAKHKQYSFDILFNPELFKTEMTKAIRSFDKKKITKKEIDVLIEGNYMQPYRFNTPDSVITLLQESINENQSISEKDMIEYYSNDKYFQNYLIIKIRDKLRLNENLELTKENIIFLEDWISQIFSRHTFKEINPRLQACIVYFAVRFDLELNHDQLLQLLTYGNYNWYKLSCFEWLKTKLDKNFIIRSIMYMMGDKVELSKESLLIFFEFLNEQKVKNINQSILSAIQNKTFGQHHRVCFIDEYLKSGAHISSLKTLVDPSDKDIFWNLIDKFIEADQVEFVLPFLRSMINNNETTSVERVLAIEKLVKLESDIGFELYLSEMCDDKVAQMDHWKIIKNFKSKESISFLFALLELCLKRRSNNDVTDQSYGDVVRTLDRIGFISYENYKLIKSEYDHLIHTCSIKRSSLIFWSKRFTENYYRHQAETRSILEVKNLIILLG